MREHVREVMRMGRLRTEIIVTGKGGSRSMLLAVPQKIKGRNREEYIRKRIEMVREDLIDLTEGEKEHG